MLDQSIFLFSSLCICSQILNEEPIKYEAYMSKILNFFIFLDHFEKRRHFAKHFVTKGLRAMIRQFNLCTSFTFSSDAISSRALILVGLAYILLTMIGILNLFLSGLQNCTSLNSTPFGVVLDFQTSFSNGRHCPWLSEASPSCYLYRPQRFFQCPLQTFFY